MPLPPAFTAAQRAHALADAGVDAILTDERAPSDWPSGYALVGDIAPAVARVCSSVRNTARRASLPDGTSKITYTSGSTGAPRGVCLSALHLETVAQSLADATAPLALRKHLCLLPLATLLENVAGVLAPLLAGARCVVPPPALTGIGSSGLDVPKLLATLAQQSPDSLILVPELLRLLVDAAERGWSPPASLRFVAVGGAVVAPALLARAIDCGLPVHEGYGLSECASVVCLNMPGASRIGTVGRALPHARVRVDAHGEIHVRGPTMLGYVGDTARPLGASLATGDLGQIDADGYLLRARARRQCVHHELWTQRLARMGRGGDRGATGHRPVLCTARRRPYVVALIVPTRADARREHDQPGRRRGKQPAALYARVRRWAASTSRFSFAEGLRRQRTTAPRRESSCATARPSRASTWMHWLPDPDGTEYSPMFIDDLQTATSAEREFLLTAPVIRRAWQGDHRDLYLVVPDPGVSPRAPHRAVARWRSARACQTRHAWLRGRSATTSRGDGSRTMDPDDIAQAGATSAAAAASLPSIATEAMVAYAYDTVLRGNPLGFFGMVFVLEGTSVALALNAADAHPAQRCRLPATRSATCAAMASSTSEHVGHLVRNTRTTQRPEDRAAVVRCAKGIYWLYAEHVPRSRVSSCATLS